MRFLKQTCISLLQLSRDLPKKSFRLKIVRRWICLHFSIKWLICMFDCFVDTSLNRMLSLSSENFSRSASYFWARFILILATKSPRSTASFIWQSFEWSEECQHKMDALHNARKPEWNEKNAICAYYKLMSLCDDSWNSSLSCAPSPSWLCKSLSRLGASRSENMVGWVLGHRANEGLCLC